MCDLSSIKGFDILFKKVSGNGLMGVWIFEVKQQEHRWFVEFIPERLPYARVNMLPEQATCTLPDNVVSQFTAFIENRMQEMRMNRLRTQRKTPPATFIQNLADLLLNEDVMPSEATQKEVVATIEQYFRNPEFILPVKGREHRYWFRVPDKGRFFVTQCPPTLS